MSETVQFAAKVSKVKTRTKGNKNYYAYRLNIPNEIVNKLQLKDDDYFFVQVGMKGKWYHLLDWRQMSTTWNMLPSKLKQEIQLSGINTLTDRKEEQKPQIVYASVTQPPTDSDISGLTTFAFDSTNSQIIAKGK